MNWGTFFSLVLCPRNGAARCMASVTDPSLSPCLFWELGSGPGARQEGLSLCLNSLRPVILHSQGADQPFSNFTHCLSLLLSAHSFWLQHLCQKEYVYFHYRLMVI